MHIFFSGIGGSGLGPLALIARQAGYEVSGSDKHASPTTSQLQKEGILVHIGQSAEQLQAAHTKSPINWLVYTSAIGLEHKHHPELEFAKTAGIKISLRDELLNKIIADQKLKLIGIAGTHGKSTTTAMVIWLLHKLKIPIGHSVGAKLSFAPMGRLQRGSDYFVYECDEFDRNFLAFSPELSLITGIAWDHHEIFPTEANYNQAFRDFLAQSKHSIMWQPDIERLELPGSTAITPLELHDPGMSALTLPGLENRQDAWLAIQGVHRLTKKPLDQLVKIMNAFPGLKQRMELLAPNLYTNYAHTPEKIRGGMNVAIELAARTGQKVVVIYEPLTNRRQHHIKHDYKDSFAGATKLHWVRTYLAREDPALPVLTPQELIRFLNNPHIAQAAEVDESLIKTIRDHLKAGDMVVAMGASGAGSLDEWLRDNLAKLTP